jgi:putative transposase
VAVFMQQAAGEFARDYNRRKERRGAFWEGRYHTTMVDSGKYLWECLNYVELNMVRCRVAGHPREWEWSGYRELMGLRRRNLLLDVEKLLWLLRTKEEAKWTESIAVGSQSFVERFGVGNRQKVEVVAEGGTWVLRECYGSVFGAEN